MPTFRIHFETGEPATVDAETPEAARQQARKVRGDAIITKVKLVRDGGQANG